MKSALLTRGIWQSALLGVILATTSVCVQAGTRVILTGEDSDARSVERNSEVFKRVISQLQESMARGGYDVIDEDMLAVKLGFEVRTRRPKTELIETLMVANQTEDATVQSRLAVVFAIFPRIKELSFSKKMEVRIRGDVYDLKTLRPMATFEYEPTKAYLIPKSYNQCDSFCIEEIIGKNSRTVARELGDVLVKKLNIVIKSLGGSTSASSGDAGSATIAVTYNLTLIRFKAPTAIKLKKYLESRKQVSSIKSIAVRESERVYAFESGADIGQIEEYLYEGLMAVGVDIDQIRIEMSQEEILVENLAM